MRNAIIVIAFCCLAWRYSQADTIHLKNGRTIFADSTHEANNKVEYVVGEDTYAIPKSSVDRIDSGGAPIHSAHGSGSNVEINLAPPTETMNRAGEVESKLFRDGHINRNALNEIESMGDADLSAVAFYEAGLFEYNNGNRDLARGYLDRALHYAPDNPAILHLYVVTLIALNRGQEAVQYAERATRAQQNSADAWYLLGVAYFRTDHTEEAVRALQRSIKLRPDPTVQALLDKAMREKNAENEFSEADSGHFALHYEGKQSSDELRRAILETLESHYNSLVGELGVAPRQTISVSLYTTQAFFDVTQSPSWSGAVYDGKLRIPIDGITHVTSELSRVLKHELTHAFINQITHGRCPQWLNEGVAQAMEPKSTSSVGRQISQLYAEHRQIPLAELEGSWMGFSNGQAYVAYYEGLAAVEYIRDTYGMSDIQRILQRLGDGAHTESVLRGTIHSGYSDLEDGIADYLKKTYGTSN